MKKIISIVTPFYNEELNVDTFFSSLFDQFTNLPEVQLEVIAVNDGSSDKTIDKLLAIHQEFQNVTVIDLSRNFGKEAALTAGIDNANGDAVIILDADLQHPPSLIPKFIAKWEDGFEVVLGRRSDRKTDSLLRKSTASLFYRFISRITNIEIPDGVGDFRLMDRRVVLELNRLRETRRFMKGLFAWVGFRTTTVFYDVGERQAGKTSFNTWKLWNFALEGITSFSSVPIRIWTYIGSVISLFSFLYGAQIALQTLVYGKDTPGYASIMVAVLFLGGIQLIGIGVLGEYIGRIYDEVKQRPIYVVSRKYVN